MLDRICHSENGWTDSELAFDWFKKDFNKKTKAKACGRTRALILDGHSSHFTPKLLKWSCENNILILGYPLHCTHALQGLDVVCFAKFKEIWMDKVTSFEDQKMQATTKDDFTRIFGLAFLRAFSPQVIKAAFEATGIHPFNRNVIKPLQLKPSKAMSVKRSFPLPQASPVRVIMSAFRSHPPTSFNLSPTTHQTWTPVPATPCRHAQHVDLNIDP